MTTTLYLVKTYNILYDEPVRWLFRSKSLAVLAATHPAQGDDTPQGAIGTLTPQLANAMGLTVTFDTVLTFKVEK